MNSRLDKNSSQVRKRIENHDFVDETGEEYEQSAFGGFGDYFRRKKIKLQNLDAEMRAASPDKPQIFKGVVAHVMGYTQPPLHILHRMLVQHGAGFLQYLDSKTMATHIIASSVPPKKSVDYSRYRLVKPAWVTDSIEAGRLLPWSDYRVNNNDGPRQKVFKLDDSKTVSQTTPQAKRGYREQTDASFYTSQFKTPAGSPATPSLTRFAERTESPLAQPQARHSYSPSFSHSTKPLPLKEKDDVEEFDDMGIDEVMVDILPEEDKDSKIEELEAKIAPPIFEKEPKQEAKSPEKMTSEEHNAVLLSDPKIWKSSTANPDFLKQFYSESRLHHLSTWKAELKSRIQTLAKEKGASPKAIKRKPGSRRYIIHVDFDSFFCAVSLKKNPQYVNKPAVVAHSSGTASEIASCNYVARKFGIKNGMWMKRALELCPDIKVLPYDFPAYEEASRLFYESILELGGVVQSVSIDEALVDITSIIMSTAGFSGTGLDEGSIWREQEKAEQIALELRDRIKESTGCAVSVGIGSNILLAKVALRRAKPAGQFQIKPEQALDIIGELEVKDLPGFAYSLSGKLEEIGVKFVKDIRQVTKERLSSTLGPKTGEKLWEYARGIDRTEVGEQPPRKSVSAEVNWGIRFINQQEAEEFILNLCKELERRLLSEQVKGKQFTMKIMRRALDAPLDPPKHLGHGKCDSFSKSILFGVATHDADTIAKEAVSILRSYRFTPGDLRGLGVQLTKLEPIKSGATGAESSQRRLAFPNFGGPAGAKKAAVEPIDDSKSPQKPRASIQSRADVAQDPIADDPLTPRKPKVHPALALARAGERDAKAQTPLNIMGTQFILPSQVDPSVLAELPSDIRAKLQRGQRSKPGASPQVKSRSNSPVVLDEVPSQVDPDVFNALPDDMKAEVLAQYGRNKVQQTRLPQSPRKDRLIQAKKVTTPTKRGGRSLFNNAKERQQDAAANRLQTNFLSNKEAGNPAQEEPEELDQEFLAELPEDVRKEIIEDHRKKRLAKRSGLLFNAPARRQQAGDLGDSLPVGQTKLQFPAPPPKVNFMGSAVKSVQEIKDMLEAWHDGTRLDGPHQDDVVVFKKYLSKVVSEERDMHKASKLVHWLSWLVEEDGSEGRGKQGWRKTMTDIKAEVQRAVKGRDLGPLRL